MSQEKTTLEVIAPTTEEAIENGLTQLGLTEEDVDIEILDSGSKGLLGIGGRQSRVKLMVKDPSSPTPEVHSQFDEKPEKDDELDISMIKSVDQDSLTDEEKQNLKVTKTVVEELLERMRVKASITPHYVEPEDERDRRVILVDIQGNDLSTLIGRRSETLNALQYITSLIVSKELNKWVPLMIDVQGYRERRNRQLRQLGRKMAEQAIQSGRKQVLEPMPANERRVIHLELRDHPQVFTESTGDEPYRKVTISLKSE
jgi:spoIIIJ-associated protein